MRSGPFSLTAIPRLSNFEHLARWRIVPATAIPRWRIPPWQRCQEPTSRNGPAATTRRPSRNTRGQQPYEPIEPKHRADEASGRQEPSANPQRAPEHQPGYEAKHQKEAKGAKQHDDAHHRSQADDAAAQREAKDDEDTLHRQKGQRAHTAARKHEVKRGSIKVKAKVKPVRKHK